MQIAYVDKYEEELRRAQVTAERVTREIEILVPYLRFVGIIEGSGKTYYYCNDHSGKYYCESEFAKMIRIKNRQKRMQRFAKK